MNKLSNTFEKLKIKAKPGKYKSLKDTCKKMQSILNRKVKNPSYTEELSFYSVFIPNLIKEMSIYKNIDEAEKMKILKFKISVWTRANLDQCAKFITLFNKGHLTETLPKKGGSLRYSYGSPKRLTSKKMYMSPVEISPKSKTASPVKRKISAKK